MMKESLPAYFSTGAGSAVVLLHCTLSSKNQWRALSGMIEGEHRVIAVDLYGYGETPMPEKREGFTLLDEVDLVRVAAGAGSSPPGSPATWSGIPTAGRSALRFATVIRSGSATLTVFEPVAFHLLNRADPGLQPVLAMMAELERLLGRGQRAEAAATFLDYWSGPGVSPVPGAGAAGLCPQDREARPRFPGPDRYAAHP